MPDLKVFLASSDELRSDRDKFRIMINDINTDWQPDGKPFINLRIWEITSEAMAPTRSQDSYNEMVDTVDLFVLLLHTKVGKYTAEEFLRAKKRFQETKKPLIYIYVKTGATIESSLNVFLNQFYVEGEEHFYRKYQDFAELERPFYKELDKYQNTHFPAIVTKQLQYRQSLLKGLEKRYNKRLEKKMNSELAFEINLKLAFIDEGIKKGNKAGFHIDSFAGNTPEDFTQLFELYEDSIGRLLILGDPGSGKTVLLLRFARKLIQQAMANSSYPIPIMLNLATWRNEGQSFKTWLEQNLVYAAGEYGTAKKYAKELVKENNMLLLLDGLDEIPETDRASCLDRLSEYIFGLENSRPFDQNSPQLIMCSRMDEYKQLENYAPVRASIMIAPLTDEVVAKALFPLKKNASANYILKLVSTRPEIVGKLSTAFRVHMALSMARQFDFENFDETTLLDAYIYQELIKISSSSLKKTKHFLHWLALTLKQTKKTVTFELTDMQPAWIRIREGSAISPTGGSNLFKITLGALRIILFIFVMYSSTSLFMIHVLRDYLHYVISTAQLKFYSTWVGLLTGIPAGVTLELLNSSDKNQIVVEEIRVFNYQEFAWSKFGRGFKNYFIKIILFFMVLGINCGLLLAATEPLGEAHWLQTCFDEFITLLFTVFSIGVSIGLIVGFFGGIIDSFFSVKRNPQVNRPYKRFLSSFGLDFLKISVPLTIICMVAQISFNIFSSKKYGFYSNFTGFISEVLLFQVLPLFVSIFISPMLKHFVLRAILSWQGKTPLRYSTFLNKVSQTGLMEKDGGQWRFRHQLIEDRLAEQDVIN